MFPIVTVDCFISCLEVAAASPDTVSLNAKIKVPSLSSSLTMFKSKSLFESSTRVIVPLFVIVPGVTVGVSPELSVLCIFKFCISAVKEESSSTINLDCSIELLPIFTFAPKLTVVVPVPAILLAKLSTVPVERVNDPLLFIVGASFSLDIMVILDTFTAREEFSAISK